MLSDSQLLNLLGLIMIDEENFLSASMLVETLGHKKLSAIARAVL